MFSVNMNVTNSYDDILLNLKKNGINLSTNDTYRILNNAILGLTLTMKNGLVIGGAILSKYDGKYLIDGIAIDLVLRHNGLCKVLINKLISKVKSFGGDSIYIITDRVDIFEKLGFDKTDEIAPYVFNSDLFILMKRSI